MATRKANKRLTLGCVGALFIILISNAALAQRFVEPRFRSYPLRAAAPDAVEDALRRFLADRIVSGEEIEIVSDQRGKRLLVRGSSEVQRMADQFIQTLDLPAVPEPIAQTQARNVRGYRVFSIEELNQKLALLRQRFANRTDVRIAGEERTRQIVVHAPEEVHRQLSTHWNDLRSLPAVATTRRLPTESDTSADWKPASERVQLQNITWQDLLRGLRSVQGPSAAVTSPQDGMLELMLASASGHSTQVRIDQKNQVVQLSGHADDTQQWRKVLQAMDTKPDEPNEHRMMGRLGDAQPSTITKTITMLGAGRSRAMDPIPSRVSDTQWGGDVVQRMFGQEREPIQLAQADNAPVEQRGTAAEGEVARLLASGDATGSFLGPVRIEFIEGTDVFIVRGQKRDVDRVMQIINNIQSLTEQTEPEVRVVQLRHANSESLADLITELNTGVLQARQGDISVTALVKPNALLLIGRESGVEAVEKIVTKLDVETVSTDRFKVFKLNFLPAVDAERTVNNLYNLQQQQQQQDETADLEPRVRAVADFRSNALVVQGSPRDLAEIDDLLRQIDIKDSATVSEVQVFQLKNALSEEVAEVLNNTLGTDQADQGQQGGFGQGQQGGTGAGGTVNTQPYSSRRAQMIQILKDNEVLASSILSNVTVSSNDRTNSIVVVAPKGSMKVIAEIIRQLDELPGQEAEIRVFPVVNGDAATLIEMLDTLFAQDQNDDGPLVQSAAGTGESTLVPLRFALDPRTNSIIASGNDADLEVVEAILLKLDSSDMSRRQTVVVELQIQQADSVAAAISNFVQLRRQTYQGIPGAEESISPYELLDQEVVVVSEPDSNKLIISATDRYFEDIMQVIRDLDKRPDMVMVHALIAEVVLGTTEEFGVELGLQDSLLFNRGSFGISEEGNPVPGFNFNSPTIGNDSTNPGSARDQLAGQALSNFDLGRTNAGLGFGGLVLSASNESVSILIRALQEANRLDVLSRPQVMMLNNTTGEVQVGAQIPYVTDSTIVGVNVQNSITFQNTGLILGVTPRISPDGLVVLDVLAENSDLGSEADGVQVSPGVRLPPINITRARTFVTARDGQTVILGGLITKERAAFERKVPYLGDVPFFGRLFRSDGVAERRTELLIILTPHIIRDEADIDRVNSEEFARMSWCLGHVIETHGDIGPSQTAAEDVIYSDMTPSVIKDVMDGVIDSSKTPKLGPTKTPVQELPTPRSADPPVADPPAADPPAADPPAADPPAPGPVLELPPDGVKSVEWKLPKKFTLFPRSKRSVWEPKERTAQGTEEGKRKEKTKQVAFDGSKETTDASRAIYRFDAVPEG